MNKINIDVHNDILDIIEKVKLAPEADVVLNVPKDSVLFENVLNVRLLEKEALALGKTLKFETSDERAQTLLRGLSETQDGPFEPEMITETQVEDDSIKKPRKKKKIKLRAPKIRGGGIKILLGLLVLLCGLGVVAKVIIERQTATIKIVVNSQPLTKSVQIKVVKDLDTDIETKTLKGYTSETVITNTKTSETTGTKTVGKVAKGKVKIFNNTLSEKEFKKGEKLKYDEEKLEYLLDDKVKVPAATETTTEELVGGVPVTTTIKTAGEAMANIKAIDIGSKYNIDSDEDMRFDDHSKDDYSLRTTSAIDGGSSSTKKVVAQIDRQTISTQLFDQAEKSAELELRTIIPATRKLIGGSLKTLIITENYSGEAGDELEKLTLEQEVSVVGLTYSEKDLDKMLDKLLAQFIPEGYELSSKDKEISVAILGNSDDTVLTESEGDLQVTIKAFMVTKIDEDALKAKLAGTSIAEAEKLLGSITNIQEYGLNNSVHIPLFVRMPINKDNIHIEVVRE